MRVVSVTDVRQKATELLDRARQDGEPILICVRSRPVAYIVEAERYEKMEHDLKRLRAELFWQGVADAEAEHRAGKSRTYGSAEELIEEIELD